MVIKHGDNEYISDDDLQANVLGFWPRIDIKNQIFYK